MKTVRLTLVREIFAEDFTLGALLLEGEHYGYICEDADRKLEAGGVKIPARTAIPRGRYRLTVSMSNRFSRLMPEIVAVPQFSGIRIHGGNTHRNTEGCPLLGEHRTVDGVRDCAKINAALIKLIVDTERFGNQCWIEVE